MLRFKEISPNDRLQIEYESDNPAYRNIKGIVVTTTPHSVILVTDFGELIEIHEDKTLSISSVQFPRIVSKALMELKNYFTEVYDLKKRLKELSQKEEVLKQALFDANFLSRFNIYGAKNRLDKSIDSSLLSFKKDPLLFHIFFQANPDNFIEMYVDVSNQFEYYNLDEIRDVEKIIRIHAPDIKELLQKCFPFASEPKETEKTVVHEKDNLYSVRTRYVLNIHVSQENFLSMRDELIRGLQRLKK